VHRIFCNHETAVAPVIAADADYSVAIPQPLDDALVPVGVNLHH
jgi:hypothetical protein